MSCSSSSGSEEEDEGIDSYKKRAYHAVRVGDLFAGGRYIAQRKLGLGEVSTIWLAYDPRSSDRVMLYLGHYVMKYMREFIGDRSILGKENVTFNLKRAFTQVELAEVRVEWINFVKTICGPALAG